jgi:hypothetical protein
MAVKLLRDKELSGLNGCERNSVVLGTPVFNTVEGTKVPWRVRFPSASAKPCYAGVSDACASIGSTAAERLGARSGRGRNARGALGALCGR